jgi:hypothetical protein
MKVVVNKQINTVLKDMQGIKIVRTVAAKSSRASGYEKNLLYEADTFFDKLFDEALVWTGTPYVGIKRRERRYNHIQHFQPTLIRRLQKLREGGGR